MMKTTVLDASGQNTLVKPSMMPRPRPVTIEPMIEPMPPITTTANTTMIRFERSEEHTSELQSLMRISYAVFCLKKKKQEKTTHTIKNNESLKRINTLNVAMLTVLNIE